MAFHYDGLGSTVNLTTQTGTTQVSYYLDPWGTIKSQTGSSVNRTVYTGHSFDENTGLIYCKSRFYDPDIARFITQDSYLGESSTPPSLHRYLYAYSNPTVYIDPDGRASIFRDASEQIDEFNKYLSGQVEKYEDGTALGAVGSVATGTSQFVGTLGQGILLPLDYIANGFQGIAGLVTDGDYSEARRDIENTHKAIGGAYNYVMDGGLVTTAKNIVGDAKTAVAEGDTTAIAKTTQTVLALATLRDVSKGKFKITRESLSGAVESIKAKGQALVQDLKAAHRSLANERGSIQVVPKQLKSTPKTKVVYDRNAKRFRDTATGRFVKRSDVPASIQAEAWQGSGAYPGIDKWRDISIKKGTIIYAGEPGVGGFFTTAKGFRRGGGNATEMFQGLQVAPHPVHGYRSAMAAYEVTEDAAAAFGRAMANPQFGTGKLPQIYLPDFQKYSRKIDVIPFD